MGIDYEFYNKDKGINIIFDDAIEVTRWKQRDDLHIFMFVDIVA